MTDLRQAAIQALEALETYKCFIDDAQIIEGQWHWLDGSDNAITALRTALEQPEQEPTQRPWVGLEAEEILDLFDINNVYGSKWIEFARTVEAKLKEKNK
jgi:hypothetical protein